MEHVFDFWAGGILATAGLSFLLAALAGDL